jgi:hypothetical protein
VPARASLDAGLAPRDRYTQTGIIIFRGKAQFIGLFAFLKLSSDSLKGSQMEPNSLKWTKANNDLANVGSFSISRYTSLRARKFAMFKLFVLFLLPLSNTFTVH